jgi:hypothetical protein
MEIKENGNKLIVSPDGVETFFDILTGSGKYSLVAFVILFALAQGNPTAAIIGLGVIILLGWFLLSISYPELVHETAFDRDTQTITMTLRSPWTLWVPHTKVITFADIIGINLKLGEDEQATLHMRLKEKIWVRFAGTTSMKSAETISKFIKSPLRIQMNNEIITHIPWSDDKQATPVPTPCAKCGAPLPIIEPGMTNLKCSHCGMTMVITWNEGKVSYKASGA